MIIGNAEIAPDMFNGFKVEAGVMSVIGDFTPYDVNDRGQAVGYYIQAFSIIHAVLYQDDQVIELNETLPNDWTGKRPTAINNYGWIVGMADDLANHQIAWLLVPIYPKGDCDGDDDVDLHDFGHFQECFAAEPYQGPEGGLHVGCSVFDFDDDIDLDLTDYQSFQAAFTGAITSGW